MCELLSDLRIMGVKAVTLSGGGEPLVYPYISEVLSFFHSNNMDYSLITNGQCLNGKIAEKARYAKWVRISLDAIDNNTYSKLRKVKPEIFDIVYNNVCEFAKIKEKYCKFGINFVVNNDNYNQIFDAALMMKKAGVDNIKFVAVWNNEPGYHERIKDEAKKQIEQAVLEISDDSFAVIDNYQVDKVDHMFEKQEFPICYTSQMITVIGADQNVYFCHPRAYDSGAIVGSIKNQSFLKLWNSDSAIKKIQNINPKEDCKNYCVYKEKNEIIQAFLDVDMEHVNFI